MISSPGVNEFIDLKDAPNTFLGSALKVVSVNALETALVFTTGGGGGGSGTVTDFIFTNGNGISGSVATSTTTPTLSLALGAITPSSVAIGGLIGSRLLAVKGDVADGIATLERTNASTNQAVGTVIIKGTSTGDMADDFGAAFQFAIEDNAGVENLIANIQGVRSGADNSGRMNIVTTNAGTPFIALSIDENQDAEFFGSVVVPDEAYGVSWDGSLEVPTKNALYDKIQTISGGGLSFAQAYSLTTLSI